MSVQVEKRYFSVADYYRMMDVGILSTGDRVELIEGEVLRMSPIGSRHAACVKKLNRLFNRKVGKNAIISVQDPIRLDDFSEPQPDLALLKSRKDFYADTHPAPSDVLLIVEVSDTSSEYDRKVKMPLYARAGIPEVCLIDLAADTLEIFAKPKNGRYQEIIKAKRSQSLSPKKLPALTLRVRDILG